VNKDHQLPMYSYRSTNGANWAQSDTTRLKVTHWLIRCQKWYLRITESEILL